MLRQNFILSKTLSTFCKNCVFDTTLVQKLNNNCSGNNVQSLVRRISSLNKYYSSPLKSFHQKCGTNSYCCTYTNNYASRTFSTHSVLSKNSSNPSHLDHHHQAKEEADNNCNERLVNNNLTQQEEIVPVDEIIRKEETVVNDNEVHVEVEELKKIQLGQLQVAQKLFLSFTCTVCSGSNSYHISKQAYAQGVVIVTCNTCKNNHLIADNLGWFEDVKGKNIEEIMAEKGEKVQKFISSDIKEVIPD